MMMIGDIKHIANNSMRRRWICIIPMVQTGDKQLKLLIKMHELSIT